MDSGDAEVIGARVIGLAYAMDSLAVAAGVNDVRLSLRREAKCLEPQLPCNAALLSTSIGIIDSHAYMLSLLADAEARGADLVLCSEVEHVHVEARNFVIQGSSLVQGSADHNFDGLVNLFGIGVPRINCQFGDCC